MNILYKIFLFLSFFFSSCSAFSVVNSSQRRSSSLAMMTPADVAPPATETIFVADTMSSMNSKLSASALNNGIQSYISQQPTSSESSTLTVALKERKIPTKEEIAAKKRNFNFWFWGGGFVAPFLATFYYFGLKFWEK